MTLIQLEYVLAVAESKNFTVAAEKTFVTQPTLSMQILKLERELDVEIFDRRTHPIKITSIGKKVIEQAKVILREANKMEHLVNEQKDSVVGEIRIGVIPTILPTLVPLFYRNFETKFPKARLIIKEYKTEEVTEKLLEEKLDFGIVATPLSQPHIVEAPMYYEPMVAYVPPQHTMYKKKKIKESDLNPEEILLLEEGHCFRNNVLSLCQSQNKYDKPIQVESGSFSSLIKLAKDGYGMTILPLLHAEDLPESEHPFIRQFENPVPTREVSLIYSKNQLRLAFAKEFKKMVQGIVRGKIFLESDRLTLPILGIPSK